MGKSGYTAECLHLHNVCEPSRKTEIKWSTIDITLKVMVCVLIFMVQTASDFQQKASSLRLGYDASKALNIAQFSMIASWYKSE